MVRCNSSKAILLLQKAVDLVITWDVLVLDTWLIYFWVALLGLTTGLNLVADIGPFLALLYLKVVIQGNQKNVIIQM